VWEVEAIALCTRYLKGPHGWSGEILRRDRYTLARKPATQITHMQVSTYLVPVTKD